MPVALTDWQGAGSLGHSEMKVLSIRRKLALVLVALFAFSLRAGAQSYSLTVADAPDPVVVSNTLTYTMNVTDVSAGNVSNLVLSVFFNSAVQNVTLQSLTGGTIQGSASFDSTLMEFQMLFGGFVNGQTAQVILTVSPTVLGTVTATSILTTNSFNVGATTNNTTQVISAQADLGVSITPPAPGAVVNDTISFGLSVTNAGPNDVPGVELTNALTGLALSVTGVTPASVPFTVSGGNLTLDLGTIKAGSITNVLVSVQATNAGTFTWTAGVSASGLVDTNSLNDTASTNYTVGTFQTGLLIATNLTTNMTALNPQTGLMDQTIRLVNTGAVAVVSARVIVSNLTVRLYNAVGTNNGSPYVAYAARLNPGDFVDLVLEYYYPPKLPFAVNNSQYTAVGVPAVDLTPPDPTGVTNFNIVLVTNVPSGLLIEFQSIPGRRYTVVYANSLPFSNSNSFAAQPDIIAPANYTQWIDDGPPKTVSRPVGTNRFYKIFLNP